MDTLWGYNSDRLGEAPPACEGATGLRRRYRLAPLIAERLTGLAFAPEWPDEPHVLMNLKSSGGVSS